MADKVLLSTDIGSDIDDALALRVMLEEPAIDLKGVYTVNGDVISRAIIARHATALYGSMLYRGLDWVEKHRGLNLSFKNKRRLANIRAKLLPFAGNDITVAIGDSEPLRSPATPYAFFEDGLVDDAFFYDAEPGDVVKIIPLEALGIKGDAVSDMAEKLSRDKYTIFSIAPMTTIARVLSEHQKVSKNIEKIIVMGSRFSDGDPIPEHNFRFDTGAAQEVLDSGVPLLVVPGDLCGKYRMQVQPLDYKKHGGSVKNYVNMLLAAFVGKNAAINLSRANQDFIGNFHETLFEWFEHTTLASFPHKEYSLAINMDDPYHAAMGPEEYFAQYRRLFEVVQDSKNKIDADSRHQVLGKLATAIPNDVSIADLYVPYVFLHPDKIKTEKRRFDCDLEGRTIQGVGKEHEVVADLDWKHFDNFVRGYFPEGFKKI